MAWKHWNNVRVNNDAPQSSKSMQSLSDSDLTPEVVDFLRKSIDHRKQRLFSF